MSTGERTTRAISHADVEKAMAYLGMHNPKPEIPLEDTVAGHLIVATAWRLESMETQIAEGGCSHGGIA